MQGNNVETRASSLSRSSPRRKEGMEGEGVSLFRIILIPVGNDRNWWRSWHDTCALCVERSLNWMVDFSCEHTVYALSDAECVS